jgi:hypothetical protein
VWTLYPLASRRTSGRDTLFYVGEATTEDTGSAHVTFLQNFFDELRRKVPLGE